MTFQTCEEREAEKQLIRLFATRMGAKIIKLQEGEDDGKTDGIIEWEGKQMNIEARRKGFPHPVTGKACEFEAGWESLSLLRDGGIWLNEGVIRNYRNNSFIYIVHIKDCDPKFCVIYPSRNEELLKQPYREQANRWGKSQPRKAVPLEWFSIFADLEALDQVFQA